MAKVKVKLKGRAPTDEQRRLYDKHQPNVVFYVFLVLFAYGYFFTDLASMLDMATPKEVAEMVGLSLDHTFADDEKVKSSIKMPHSTTFSSDQERLILFGIIFLTFTATYFLEVKFKKYGGIPMVMIKKSKNHIWIP